MSAEKTMKIVIFTAAILGFLAGGIAQASSFNLTGTWEGQAVCDELIDGKYTFDVFRDPLKIIQDGDIVHVAAFGVIYEGTVQQLKRGPNDGEAVIHTCGGTPENEVVRIQHIDAKPNGEGKLDAITPSRATSSSPARVLMVPANGATLASRTKFPKSPLAIEG
jgi:hypothetical protein